MEEEKNGCKQENRRAETGVSISGKAAIRWLSYLMNLCTDCSPLFLKEVLISKTLSGCRSLRQRAMP